MGDAKDDRFSALSGHSSTGLVGQTERYCRCRDAPNTTPRLLCPGLRALLSNGGNSILREPKGEDQMTASSKRKTKKTQLIQMLTRKWSRSSQMARRWHSYGSFGWRY
jgi:hypothetical protein